MVQPNRELENLLHNLLREASRPVTVSELLERAKRDGHAYSKKEINQILYPLAKRGLVAKSNDKPPRWWLDGRPLHSSGSERPFPKTYEPTVSDPAFVPLEDRALYVPVGGGPFGEDSDETPMNPNGTFRSNLDRGNGSPDDSTRFGYPSARSDFETNRLQVPDWVKPAKSTRSAQSKDRSFDKGMRVVQASDWPKPEDRKTGLVESDFSKRITALEDRGMRLDPDMAPFILENRRIAQVEKERAHRKRVQNDRANSTTARIRSVYFFLDSTSVHDCEDELRRLAVGSKPESSSDWTQVRTQLIVYRKDDERGFDKEYGVSVRGVAGSVPNLISARMVVDAGCQLGREPDATVVFVTLAKLVSALAVEMQSPNVRCVASRKELQELYSTLF